MPVSTSASVSMKSSLARTHFQNAKLFRDKAKELEAIFGDEDSSDIPLRNSEDHKAYCFSSVMSAVSFVEAQANEFVENLQEDKKRIDQGKDPHHYPDIQKAYRDSIVSTSNLDNRLGNASPPVKYNALLNIMGLQEFDREDSPLEQVLVLNRLRNELTHFSPEWVEGGPKKYTENEYGFEEDLKGRFELNPMTADGNAFFPTQCMSYGCAEWATRYSRALVQHFGHKIDVDMRAIS